MFEEVLPPCLAPWTGCACSIKVWTAAAMSVAVLQVSTGPSVMFLRSGLNSPRIHRRCKRSRPVPTRRACFRRSRCRKASGLLWRTASGPLPSWVQPAQHRNTATPQYRKDEHQSNLLLLGGQQFDCSHSGKACDRRIWPQRRLTKCRSSCLKANAGIPLDRVRAASQSTSWPWPL